MAKSTQIMKLVANGKKFSIVYREDSKANPYTIYRHTWGLRECGYGMTEHKRMEVKYADIKSCLFYLAQIV